jgi:hypothetical protein
MINRIAIFAATLVAALALTVGLVLAGLAPGTGAADAQTVSDPVVATTDAPVVQTDIVYVAPDPTPQEVVVTKVENSTKVTTTHHGDDGDDEGEHEGQDD